MLAVALGVRHWELKVIMASLDRTLGVAEMQNKRQMVGCSCSWVWETAVYRSNKDNEVIMTTILELLDLIYRKQLISYSNMNFTKQ